MSEPVVGHAATPLVDGAAVFESVHRDLLRARRRVYVALWGLEEEFILHRGPDGETTFSRFCKAALAANPDLELFVLVWDWFVGQVATAMPGLLPMPKTPPVPRAEALCRPADRGRVHVALHGNPPVGSHHQKFILCDLEDTGASLHCLGLNLQNHCWDADTHPFPHAYPEASRPWHDVGVRLEGPVVRDFEEEFRRRWRAATGEELPGGQFDDSARGITRVSAVVHREQSEPSPAKQWYLARLPRARDFVYLENQYFDDPDVTKTLYTAYLEAERRGARLPIALVLPWWEDISRTHWPPWHPIAPWTLYNATELRVRTAERVKIKGSPNVHVRPPGGWPEVRAPADPDRALALANPANREGAAQFAKEPRHFAVRDGERWVEWRDVDWVEGGIEVYRMMAATARWPAQPVYVHSKLAIVDDAYLVGSSNVSHQSFVIDSEIDVAVEGHEEVTRFIEQLWPQLAGAAAPADRSVGAWLDALAAAAAHNRAAADHTGRGRPPPPVGMLLPWEPLEY
jgi:phosphatidylserine/phosphatidylglycerophosphate/cardiolipin synthase-like enzyme